MSLSFRLRHRFPGFDLDVAFQTETPGITVLFGGSGAGKSSVIAASAGLWRPEQCAIAIDGAVLADTGGGTWLPPEHRRAGLVFQDARLFPHMSVAANLRFGLRRAPSGPIRFDDVVGLLGIEGLLDRRPRTLSGGERQRVAIGRALLSQPRLLLMDEPLASLDAPRKTEIMPYLTRLKATLSLPVLYVTHAVDEVTRLADSLVLIEDGRVAGFGPVAEIAARTDLPFARRDDASALVHCTVSAHEAERALTRLEGGGASFWVPRLDRDTGTSVRIRVPAREVILAGEAPRAISLHNVLAGTVRRIAGEAGRASVLVEVALPAAVILARVTPDAVTRLGLHVGGPVLGLVKSTSIEVLLP